MPERYRVAAVLAEDTVARATCPGGPVDEGLRCTSDGVGFDDAPLEVTVKARGYRFATLARPAPAINARALRLEPIGELDVTEDYATGFDDDQGSALFERMAYAFDTELGPAHSIKFYVRALGSEPEIFFQNTRRYPLHYDFARKVLGVPGTVREFEAATYSGAERTAMAGTVIAYPAVETQCATLGGALAAPLVLSFFPSDDLTPEQAHTVHRLIEERLLFSELNGGERRLVYVPAGEAQERAVSEVYRDWAARDALILGRSELYARVKQQILNPGLAYGTLRRLDPAARARAAPLASTDIVLLPRLPNELPLVGGSISEELQTPLAHVNIAARTRGTPNLALVGASEDARVAPFLGQLVRFEVTRGGFAIGSATRAEAEAFWASRVRERHVLEFDASDIGLPGFEEIGFEDAPRVGVKAANLAELSQLVPGASPGGFAVPFWAYERFMREARVTEGACGQANARCGESGRDAAACAAADALCRLGAGAGEHLFGFLDRLLSDGGFSVDAGIRDASLLVLSELIETAPLAPELAAALDATVAARFGGRQVRLRSSTNSEDLPGFSGAGLYESVSAFATGPERASLRIREVWASAFSYRAFEERRYWNIDQKSVRMGVAIHPAYDDELANGVLITQNIVDPTTAGMYLNVQLGETSVTNPELETPEELSLIPAPGGRVQAARLRFSSLSPGAPVLTPGELDALQLLASRVQAHFARLYQQSPFVLALDLEFKLLSPDRALLVKQVRPYTGSLH